MPPLIVLLLVILIPLLIYVIVDMILAQIKKERSPTIASKFWSASNKLVNVNAGANVDARPTPTPRST